MTMLDTFDQVPVSDGPVADLSAFIAKAQGRPSPLAHVKEPDGGFYRKGPSGPPLVSDPDGTLAKSGKHKGDVRLVQYGAAEKFVELIEDLHEAETQACRDVIFGVGVDPKLMRQAVEFAARPDIDERAGKNDGNSLAAVCKARGHEHRMLRRDDALMEAQRLATIERRDWLARTLLGIADGAATEHESELVERFGLDVASPAPMVAYERASKLYHQIAEHEAVLKWDWRKIVQGIGLDAGLQDRARALAADPRVGEPLWCEEADDIAAHARRCAKANRASTQGTHAHALTEFVDLEQDPIELLRSGSDIGVPVDVGHSLIAAWQQMCTDFDLEPLAVEARVVNDHYRVAGSADRFMRVNRDLTFPMFDGSQVTIPAGTVCLSDIKSGALKLDRTGYPAYWQGYACQFAVYASHSRPYTPDTGERGEWPWPVSQEWALLFHLDVLGALSGRPSCTPYLVSLQAGRDAADLVVAAKAYADRRDVISLAPSSGREPAGMLDSGMSTLFDASTVATEADREAMRARLNTLRRLHPDRMHDLAAVWPAGVPTKFTDHLHTVAELAALHEAVSQFEVMVRAGAAVAESAQSWLVTLQSGARDAKAMLVASVPSQPVEAAAGDTAGSVAAVSLLEGGEVDKSSMRALAKRIDELAPSAVSWLGEVAAQAAAAGCGILFVEGGERRHTVRRFDVARGLCAVLEMCTEDDRAVDVEGADHLVRVAVFSALSTDVSDDGTAPTGVIVGQMPVDAAARFAGLCVDLADGSAGMSYSETGVPRIVPTVACSG